MGRKNKHTLMEQNKGKKQQGQGQGTSNKAKLNKVKKAFKVTSQNKIKKAKPVQNSVKMVKKDTPSKGKAGEALNAKFNKLHKDMVVSKPKVAQVPKPAVKAKAKGKAPKATDVAKVLEVMDV